MLREERISIANDIIPNNDSLENLKIRSIAMHKFYLGLSQKMTKICPQCTKEADLSPANIYRPFCSEKCKLIDFGSWTNEEKLISRPIESEDFLSRLNYFPLFSCFY